MSGTTLAPAIGTPLPSRCVSPGTSAQVSPSLLLVPRLLRRVVRGLGNLLLFVVVLAFTGLAVGPHVLGYRTMTMLTGSMAPGINPGDVTVAVQEPTSALPVGQIISYQIPMDDHRVVSHRVVKVTRSPSGAVVVQTRRPQPERRPLDRDHHRPPGVDRPRRRPAPRRRHPHAARAGTAHRLPVRRTRVAHRAPAQRDLAQPESRCPERCETADCLRARHRRAQRPRRGPRRRQQTAHVPRPVDQHADRPGLRPAGCPRG